MNDKAFHVTQESELPKLYFDGGKYWRPDTEGNFVAMGADDVTVYLKRLYVPTKQPSTTFQFLTLDELVRSDAQTHRFVEYAGPLAGHRPGLFETSDGRKILVTRGPKVPPAVRGDWTTLWEFFVQLLGEDQATWFLYWLKAAREDLLASNWRKWHASQLVVLAGEGGSGKGMLHHVVTEFLGGRAAKPYRYMVEKTDFNGDLGKCESWVMEDEVPQRDMRSRRAFGTKIKEATVNQSISIHPKGKEAFTVPIYRRTTASVNDEAENLCFLPPWDNSIEDKIALLATSPRSHVTCLTEDRERNLKITVGCLPALCWYLDCELRIPDDWKSARYQVRAYHNPGLLAKIVELEPQTRLLELIDEIFFPDEGRQDAPHGCLRVTAAELERKLRASEFSQAVASLLGFSSACGTYLGRLAAKHPERIDRKKSGNVVTWEIQPPPQPGEVGLN